MLGYCCSRHSGAGALRRRGSGVHFEVRRRTRRASLHRRIPGAGDARATVAAAPGKLGDELSAGAQCAAVVRRCGPENGSDPQL